MSKKLLFNNTVIEEPTDESIICLLNGSSGSGNDAVWLDASNNGNDATLHGFSFDGSTNGWMDGKLRTGDKKGYIQLCPLGDEFTIKLTATIHKPASYSYQRLITVANTSSFQSHIGVHVGSAEYNVIRCFEKTVNIPNTMQIAPNFTGDITYIISYNYINKTMILGAKIGTADFYTTTINLSTAYDSFPIVYLNAENSSTLGRDVSYEQVVIYDRSFTEEEIKNGLNTVNGLVQDMLYINLYKTDITNRRLTNGTGDQYLTINNASVEIADNYIYVPKMTGECGYINVSFSSECSVSYVIDAEWENSIDDIKQFISGPYKETFYFWLSSRDTNMWYSNVKYIDNGAYTTAYIDDPKFIDITISSSSIKLYIDGILKAEKTINTPIAPSVSQQILNAPISNKSTGNFKLYSYKVYHKCLTYDEILQNIEYEKERLSFS